MRMKKMIFGLGNLIVGNGKSRINQDTFLYSLLCYVKIGSWRLEEKNPLLVLHMC